MKLASSVLLFSVCGAVVLKVQNNFEKKKREIADALNALTNEALEVEKSEAEPLLFGQVQECAGECCDVVTCNQSIRRKKRQLIKLKLEIAEAINELAEETPDDAPEETASFESSEEITYRKKRQIKDAIHTLTEEVFEVDKQEDEALEMAKKAAESQVQNLERIKRDIVELNPHGFDFGLVQDCQGGNCGQYNAGGFGNVQRCRGAGCRQANTGGFGHVQDCRGGQCGQLNNLRGKREDAVHTLTCAGSVSSKCEGKDCVVSCSDGGEVSLVCEDEIVDISSDSANVEVRCGSAERVEKQLQAFRSLFPF